MNKVVFKKRLAGFLKGVVWVIIMQFVLINISSSIYAWKLTHFYTDHTQRNDEQAKGIIGKTWKLFTGPRQFKSVVTQTPAFAYENVTLKRKSGDAIHGWFAKTDSASPLGTVLFFHGVTSSKQSLLNEAGEFLKWGYHVFLIDFRGHGNSDGTFTSIGTSEPEEVKLAWDHVTGRGEGKIYLYGVSMGAVVVTKAIHDYSLQPAGLILDMPFRSLQSHLKGRARMLGFPSQPFAFLTTFWIGAGQGLNGYRHNTCRYAKEVGCPVLLQWGDNDPLVTWEETNFIYEALKTSQKRLVVYESAGHQSFLQFNPEKWRNEVRSFMLPS